MVELDFKIIEKALADNEIEQEKIDSIIEQIKSQQEAIDGYEKAKMNCLDLNIPSNEYDRLVKVFNHIIEEEKEHIKELVELIGGIK